MNCNWVDLETLWGEWKEYYASFDVCMKSPNRRRGYSYINQLYPLQLVNFYEKKNILAYNIVIANHIKQLPLSFTLQYIRDNNIFVFILNFDNISSYGDKTISKPNFGDKSYDSDEEQIWETTTDMFVSKDSAESTRWGDCEPVYVIKKILAAYSNKFNILNLFKRDENQIKEFKKIAADLKCMLK